MRIADVAPLRCSLRPPVVLLAAAPLSLHSLAMSVVLQRPAAKAKGKGKVEQPIAAAVAQPTLQEDAAEEEEHKEAALVGPVAEPLPIDAPATSAAAAAVPMEVAPVHQRAPSLAPPIPPRVMKTPPLAPVAAASDIAAEISAAAPIEIDHSPAYPELSSLAMESLDRQISAEPGADGVAESPVPGATPVAAATVQHYQQSFALPAAHAPVAAAPAAFAPAASAAPTPTVFQQAPFLPPAQQLHPQQNPYAQQPQQAAYAAPPTYANWQPPAQLQPQQSHVFNAAPHLLQQQQHLGHDPHLMANQQQLGHAPILAQQQQMYGLAPQRVVQQQTQPMYQPQMQQQQPQYQQPQMQQQQQWMSPPIAHQAVPVQMQMQQQHQLQQQQVAPAIAAQAAVASAQLSVPSILKEQMEARQRVLQRPLVPSVQGKLHHCWHSSWLSRAHTVAGSSGARESCAVASSICSRPTVQLTSPSPVRYSSH